MANTEDVINTTTTEELEYGECCCCLEKGDHRELTKQYYLDKRPEIYEVIFKDTFGIVLKYPEGTKLICDCCIVELRQARHFRFMVESTQQRLSDRANLQPEFDNVKEESSPTIDIVKQEVDNLTEEQANQIEWSECTFEVFNDGIEGTYTRLEELLTAEQQLESVKEELAPSLNIECIKEEPDHQLEEEYVADQDSRKRDFAITQYQLKQLKVRLTRDPAVEQIYYKTQKRQKKQYLCDFCPYKSAYRGNLARHLYIHCDKETLGKSKKTYHCDLCTYTTTRREHMINHLNIHVGLRPYSCRLCEFRSVTSANLKDHMRTHTGEKPFSCQLCKFRTARKGNLRDHMRTHTGEKPYSCKFCSYRGAMKAYVKQHVREWHSGETQRTSTVSVKKKPNSEFVIS